MSKPPFSKKRKGKTVDPYPLSSKQTSKSTRTKGSRGRPRSLKKESPQLTVDETKRLVENNLSLLQSLTLVDPSVEEYTDIERGFRVARKGEVINLFGPYIGRRKDEYTQGVYIDDPPKGWESLGLAHSHPWEAYAEFSRGDMENLEREKHQIDIVTGHKGGEILLHGDQWLFFDFRGNGCRTEAEMNE